LSCPSLNLATWPRRLVTTQPSGQSVERSALALSSGTPRKCQDPVASLWWVIRRSSGYVDPAAAVGNPSAEQAPQIEGGNFARSVLVASRERSACPSAQLAQPSYARGSPARNPAHWLETGWSKLQLVCYSFVTSLAPCAVGTQSLNSGSPQCRASIQLTYGLLIYSSEYSVETRNYKDPGCGAKVRPHS